MPGWLELGLLAGAGALATGGGLLWTGLYGMPHKGGIGFVLWVLGAAMAAAFAGLTEKEFQPDDGPPE